MAQYELWYADYFGERVCPIWDVLDFEYVKVIGDVGSFKLTCPVRNQLYQKPWTDYRILIYRKVRGQSPSFEFSGLIRGSGYDVNRDSQQTFSITGVDSNDLLNRRIIAYSPETAEARVSGVIDDGMKRLVEENLVDNADYSGSGLDPSRSISDYGFSIAGDHAIGPVASSQDYSWDNLLKALQELQSLSRTLGTEVFFEVADDSPGIHRFKTELNYLGVDRTMFSENPAIFSLAMGNLHRPRLVYDRSREANFLYIGGSGVSSDQEVGEAYDLERVQASPFNRSEAYGSAVLEATSGGVENSAEQQLTRHRPIAEFQTQFKSHPSVEYGGVSGWRLGDLVSVEYFSIHQDTVIRGVNVKVDSSGEETITGRIEIYDEL